MEQFKAEKKVIVMFLTLLGFDYFSTNNKGEIWKHHVKNLTTNLTNSSNDLCNNGHTGPICDVCLDGWAKNDGKCYKCLTTVVNNGIYQALIKYTW